MNSNQKFEKKIEEKEMLNKLLNQCKEGKVKCVIALSPQRFANDIEEVNSIVNKLWDSGVDVLYIGETNDTDEKNS